LVSASAEAVAHRLGLEERHRAWLEALEASPDPPRALRLPPPGEARALLGRLGVAEVDAEEVVAHLPSPAGDPDLWWLLERSYARQVAHMGAQGVDLPWPELPDAMGARGRLFLVFLFLGCFEEVRRWHREHGVPDAVSWETLRSLGRSMAIHRRRQGRAGVFEPSWMTLPFRGCLFELGRLQYTPFTMDDGWVERLGGVARSGERTVGIHIPESGPLAPEAVSRSLERARELFSSPLPFGPCRIAVCGSWLLDDQLAEYLPATANIVQFQRRFHMVPGYGNGDRSVFNFVFHRPPTDALDELPQRTTLERAIVAHWRTGLHWHTRTGWLEL
jgi:hypothetical protein